VSADTVLEAFTASALHWNVTPHNGFFEDVEALVDFESFLDIDAQHESAMQSGRLQRTRFTDLAEAENQKSQAPLSSGSWGPASL
jgi:hypothetical protein